jgi:hypothetical protein
VDLYSGRHTAGLTVRARVIVGVLMALAATVVASAGVGAAGEPATCTIQTLGTVSGPVNLSAARELHLRQGEAVTIRLLASSPQSHAQPGVTLFGFGLPLPAEAVKYAYFVEGPHPVADPSHIARALAFSFRTESCSTSLLAVVDDQNPLFTLVGGGGAALAVLATMGLLVLRDEPARFSRRMLGALLGLLAGIGLSLLLQQLLWLDPRSYDTLIPPAVGLILGAVSPGALATRPSTPASS